MATAPRTITVRVRTLVVLAAAAVAAGLVWWGLSYATGMQPLSTGSSSTEPVGLRIAAETPDALAPGRGPSCGIRAGIRGDGADPQQRVGAGDDHRRRPHVAGLGGAISGPTLANGDPGSLEPIMGPFHHVRVRPDGYGVVTLVFHANPRARCGGGSTTTMDSVRLHFTTLDVFHDTQDVPLGDMAAS